MKKTVFAGGLLLALLAANEIRLNIEEAAVKKAETARYQSLIRQCLASERYSLVPGGGCGGQVYGAISRTSQCADEAVLTMRASR